jgi:adenylate cyclase
MYNKAKIIESTKRIAFISVLWIFFLFFYYFIIFFTIEEIAPERNVLFEFIILVFTLGLLFGLLNGILEVFIFSQKFKRIKFVYTVILKTILFIAAFNAAVTLFIIIKNYLLVPIGIINEPYENEIAEFFGSSLVYKHGLYALLFSFGINFLLQIDKKMGKNVLFNLFFGKFHTPRKLEKIILFLDLTSSTTIAEKIGDYKYSAFLKEFFYDLDEVINETKGAVHQYVGDEVVVLWDVKEGIENNNCIRCFYNAKKIIQDKKESYIKKYGVFPEFKTGIHLGEVVVTEVGGVKSEIAYHGDTINTASRLCAEARNHKNGLLISAELLGFLEHLDKAYFVESVGLIKFKGKRNDIASFAVYEK